MSGSVITETVNLSITSAIEAMIKKSCIIDFGVIQQIVAKGIVAVSVSVAESKKDVRYMTCTLVNLASDSFTLNIEPNVGDKVLVLYPRKFSSKMFNKDSKDVLIDSTARGYNMMCGLAILCNQYKTDTHNNIMNIKNGELDLKLAYDKDNNKNKVNITINKDGKIMIDNSKSTVTVDSSGNVEINAKSGKVSIKNNEADLFTIINGMLQILNATLTTAGSPASHTVVPNQFTDQISQLSSLMQ